MSSAIMLPTHRPVMLNEVIEALQVEPGKRYVDCTLGSGGHAEAILKRIMPYGQLLGIDTDIEAINLARSRLANYAGSIIIVHDNFANLSTICKENNFLPVHGILIDLGVSTTQLDAPDRGFSFRYDACLDMRFNRAEKLTAADIVNTFPEEELNRLIRTYGEERHSRQIVHNIVKNRPIVSTLHLARVVEQVTGHRRGRIHPATRTFLALRIAVNHELENLAAVLKQAVECLESGGRLVVISYHSLEDRIVKQFINRESKGCICPPGTPVCQCNHVPRLKIISKKPIRPSSNEIGANPRSRSAKLRIAERINIPQEVNQS